MFVSFRLRHICDVCKLSPATFGYHRSLRKHVPRCHATRSLPDPHSRNKEPPMLQRSQTTPESRENRCVCYRNVFMLLGAIHNRQCVLCVFQLGSKRRQRDKMVGIPKCCLEPSGLYLWRQTVKEASGEASLILFSQKVLDFLQG